MTYYRYCYERGMLPSATPAVSKLSQSINRYNLAYLFAKTIDDQDMPKICDYAIGDLSSIPGYYKASVEKLYAAGVMIGMDSSYRFCGTSTTSRGQIATVICLQLDEMVPGTQRSYLIICILQLPRQRFRCFRFLFWSKIVYELSHGSALLGYADKP